MTSRPEALYLTPYARSLGIEDADLEGRVVLSLDFGQHVEGRPSHLHGGAISGLLETAGYAALQRELEKEGRSGRLKPINITVQFLRAGKTKASFAEARIVKLGRRTANLVVEAWQDEPDTPIATAVMNIMIVREKA